MEKMEKSMREEWKPVRGFENYAEISNFGQIHRFERVIYFGTNHQSKRIQEEEWTYGCESGDYLKAGIGGVNKGVHVWVYLTFVGDIPEGYEVNHIDENKYNNRLDNLNLMTRKENINWGTANARRADALRGKPNPKVADAHRGQKRSEETKKKISDALIGRKRPDIAAANSKPVQALDPATMEVVYEFPSTMEAQRQGFSASAVSRCCRNCFHRPGNNVYKGLIWRFRLPQ